MDGCVARSPLRCRGPLGAGVSARRPGRAVGRPAADGGDLHPPPDGLLASDRPVRLPRRPACAGPRLVHRSPGVRPAARATPMNAGHIVVLALVWSGCAVTVLSSIALLRTRNVYDALHLLAPVSSLG